MDPQGLGYLAKVLGFSTDQFDKLIADNTKNKIDLASHYPYSPERWRIFVDNSRVFPEYNSVSQYNHATDVHQLKPAAGETVVLETAERPRYVVQYELATTWALSLNQALGTGDVLRAGQWDGTDGWFLEQTDQNAEGEVTLKTLRAGSVATSRDVSLSKALTTFTRFALLTNWYNVGAQKFHQTFTKDNGTQVNDVIGRMSVDDGRGPQVGNLPIRFEVTAGAGTSGLTLNAGSVASVTLGNTEGLTRTKVSEHEPTLTVTGAWEPLIAIRTDPDREIVNTQLVDVLVAEYDAADDVKFLATAHDSSKVVDSNGDPLSDSDYSTPNNHHPQNSVVEVSTAVAQAPDVDGNLQSSTTDTGGFQIGYGSLYTGGAGGRQSERTLSRKQKRPIFGRDVVVLWGKSDTAGTAKLEVATEQDW